MSRGTRNHSIVSKLQRHMVTWTEDLQMVSCEILNIFPCTPGSPLFAKVSEQEGPEVSQGKPRNGDASPLQMVRLMRILELIELLHVARSVRLVERVLPSVVRAWN